MKYIHGKMQSDWIFKVTGKETACTMWTKPLYSETWMNVGNVHVDMLALNVLYIKEYNSFEELIVDIPELILL